MMSNRIRPFIQFINRNTFISQSNICYRTLYHQEHLFGNKNVFNKHYCTKSKMEQAIEKMNSEQSTNAKSVARQILSDEDNYIDRLLLNITTTMNERNKVFHNDVANLLKNLPSKSYISTQNINTILKCCSSMLIDETPEKRMALLNQILNYFKGRVTFNLENYHELLRTYYDNKHKFLVSNFIQEMHPKKPSVNTYALLLSCVCQNGDINQAEEIMSNMKSSRIDFTEPFFNILIEGYGKAGDVKGIREVLNTMNSLDIVPTIDTEKSIIKSLITMKDETKIKDRLTAAIEKSVEFSEIQIIEIIECLVENNMNSLTSLCIDLLPSKVKKENMSAQMLAFCMHIIYQGHYKTALEIYYSLPATDIGTLINVSTSGRLLLRKCVKVLNNWSDVLNVIKGFKDTERNSLAEYTAFESAMHYGKHAIGIEIMKLLKANNEPIRTHYFWPLFVQASREEGEKGIFQIISLMESMNVIPDNETLATYVMPKINFVLPKETLKKLQMHGLPISSCFTAIVLELLKTKDIESASEMCETIHAQIDCEVLMQPLLHSFFETKNVNSVHNILRAFQAKPKQKTVDWIGKYLVALITFRKWKMDIKYFNDLVTALYDSETKCSETAINHCLNILNEINTTEVDVKYLREMLTNMIDLSFVHEQNVTSGSLPSQENMSLIQLESHLVELESNGSNTRGVLRKLLQQYVRQKDYQKALAIIKKCQDSKMLFSNGMKSLMFDVYVKTNDLKKADLCLRDLLQLQQFTIDEYKVLDFATALIKNGDLSRAVEVLTERASKRKIYGGNNIETNCWNLLNAVAQHLDPEETKKMLEFLRRFGYCKVTNILLGPIVRAYLNKNDIMGAVDELVKCGSIHRKTPLKHEVLLRIVRGCSNLDMEFETNLPIQERKQFYQNLLMKVQSIDTQVHGPSNAQISLIAALAENNMSNELRKMILEPSFEINMQDILNQCERFCQENKMNVLYTIADSIEGTRGVNVNDIYELMIKVLYRKDDCDGALNVWNKMMERNIKPSPTIVDVLTSMLKSNNKPAPLSLNTYLNEESKALLN